MEGFDLGFHFEGYRTVWANDIDTCAVKTFERNIGDVIVASDIEEVDPFNDRSIPKSDLILGGFPCQDFSIIWKQPGLNGKRGNLYKSFLKFINAKKPKAFVAENVKGLLNANNKQAIQQIIKDFEVIEPGYLIKIQLYNFADYGVPQFRERVLIVGVRLDTGFHFRHPCPDYGPQRTKPYKTAKEALQNVEEVEYNNEHMNISESTKAKLKLIPEGGNFTNIPKDSPLYVKGMISHVYRRIKLDEPAKTIIAAGGGGTWGYHYPEPRPLTNRERARLQTFPDNFILEGSIAEVRRQIGNAVPPQGVRKLARSLKPLFTGEYAPNDIQKLNERLKRLNINSRLSYDIEYYKNKQKLCSY